MSALEVILVSAAILLALIYVFRIGFKKPEKGDGCGGGCGCSGSTWRNRQDH